VARHYGVVTDRYKLVHYYGLAKPEWELFDRQTDPQELKSVWSDPKYAERRMELETELARLRKELKVPEVDPVNPKK
jgi:arylsulfatase A-like enzyme